MSQLRLRLDAAVAFTSAELGQGRVTLLADSRTRRDRAVESPVS